MSCRLVRLAPSGRILLVQGWLTVKWKAVIGKIDWIVRRKVLIRASNGVSAAALIHPDLTGCESD
jgi:hypothetical protein